jgi:hypothetical protein
MFYYLVLLPIKLYCYVYFILGPTDVSPSIAFAHAYVQKKNDFCTILSTNDFKPCVALPYYSNPDLEYKGEALGGCYSQNARWIKENRFRVEAVGDESMICKNTYTFEKNLIVCLLRTTNSVYNNCDYLYPDYVNWG